MTILDGDTDLRESRLSHHGGRLLLQVVPEAGVDHKAIATRLREAYEELFARLETSLPEIEIECLDSLERGAVHMGKMERVHSEDGGETG